VKFSDEKKWDSENDKRCVWSATKGLQPLVVTGHADTVVR
jgi:hypothetical protein